MSRERWQRSGLEAVLPFRIFVNLRGYQMKNGSLFLIATLVLGCGSNSSEQNDQGRQCPPPALHLSSVDWSCNDQATAAFGFGYSTGDFRGGLCPNFMACSCDNFNMDYCASQDGTNCLTAFKALDKCLNSGFPCPTGIWKTDYGYSVCGKTNVVTELSISFGEPGDYSLMMTTGPFPPSDPFAGPNDCEYRFYKTLSTSFVGRKVTSTLQRETRDGFGETLTVTMDLRSNCLQADVDTIAVGCSSCDGQGNCSGAGGLTCDDPPRVAVRIHP
jgi:hypothetical protein